MKSRLFKPFIHILILACFLAVLFVATPLTPARAAALPIEQLLNPDGTLNLSTHYNGSLDTSDYGVRLDPLHGPVFSPLMTYNAWGSLGLGTGPNNIVYAIAINGSNVYIGGQFTDVNGNTSANRIAKWNGISWSALGSGISNGQVNALAINGSDLYVGGNFTSAGGVSGADYIAKWNGSTWSTFGNGISGAGSSVNAIGVSSNGLDIYVAGNFTNAGGDTNADYIAKLDGGTWAALGATPLTGAVNAIIVAGPSVYAGGDFVDVGGNGNIDRIALWDGSSWTPLGNGLGASVSTIALNGVDLYAGGQFTDAGGNANADRIAKWDGSAWSALGSGLNSFVSTIAISGGKLYAGGHFTNAGSDAIADYIAQWDGVSWSALGNTALDSDVASIVINGLLVYAGGNFTAAGGVPSANRIAFFQFENTLPTVTSFTATSPSNSLNIPITAFTASDNVGVTGYKITESSTPPLTSDAGWTGSAPSTYTVASSGSYTLYPWARDASGNVSAVYGSPASVTVDASAPTVTSFSAPSTSSSLTISGITVSASDNIGVTGYLITESATPPSVGAAGWTGSAPTSFTVASSGSHTLYPWAKDAVGNVSAVYGSPATVNVDTGAPTVTAFAATSPSTSLNIPITSFSASDDLSVTDYLITESASQPSAGAAGWTASAPSTYTVTSSGTYTLYPWAKDAAGQVSAAYGSPATVSVDTDLPTVDSFSVPSTSNSLDIDITTFTASDNIGVTGYMITTSSGQPSAGDSSWTASAPTTYTVTNSGIYALYPWAKDAVGNISSVYGSPATVTACVPSPITVTSSADSGAGTLRQAIAAACAGATINFDSALSGATIRLSSTLNLTKNVTIDGSSLASQVILNGDSDNNGSGNVRVIFVNGAVNVVLDSLTITKGSASGTTGGGIRNDGTLTIRDSTITGNAASFGGGIQNNWQLTVLNSTISNNSASIHGGGILNFGGVMDITNSTISGNTASSKGGGIGQLDGASAPTSTFTNDTISGNSAPQGGGIHTFSGTLNYTNTIIANSTGGDCTMTGGSIGTNTKNLVEDGSCSATFSGDPNLGALASNGGPTQTFALLAGSPAINAGDNPTCAASPVNNLDQRGATRPDGTSCDIGAYEASFAPTVTAFTVTSPANSLTVSITAFSASDGSGVAGYMVTDSSTPPSTGAASWTVSAPTTYTLSGEGSHTLYPWAKDSDGNVSLVYGSPASVIYCTTPGTRTVTSSADSGAGTLRQTIKDSCVGDTIKFDSSLADGIIRLNSTLELSADVTIDASDLIMRLIITGDSDNDADGDVRVFKVDSGVTATLDGLTITYGKDAGGLGGNILNLGTLTIIDSTIWNGYASSGGGIANDGTAQSLTLLNSTVINNAADHHGAGIAHWAGSMTIANSTFSGNATDEKGGAIAFNSSSGATLLNSTISGNSDNSTGGGIYFFANSGPLNYSNNVIANNSDSDCGGTPNIGIHVNNLIENGFASCLPTFTGDPNLGPLADNGGPNQTFALLSGSSAIDAGDDTTCAASPVSNLDQRGQARPADAHCDLGSYEGDFSAPSVVSIARANTNPTNTSSTNFTITFSEPVTGVDTGDFSLVMSGVSGATVSSVSGSGTTRTVSVNTGSGDGTIRLDLLSNGSIQDGVGNSLSGSFTSGQSYMIDKTAPTVISSVRVNANPTNAASVDYTVTFSEFVTGIDATDFSLLTSGGSDAYVTGVTGSGATRTVSITTGSASATLRLDVLNDSTITDLAGNTLSGDFTSGESYTFDISEPSVVSSVRANTSPTKLTSVSFTVTFSESVTAVDAADFSLTTSGVTGASVSGVTGSGTTYTVTVSTGSGNGTIRLDLPVSATVTDAVGNSLSGIPYTSGQPYTITKTVTLTIMSTNTQDGWVLESSETSNKGSTLNSTLTTFRLGDDASKKQYRGILAFKTSTIPDTAVITAVTLKVKKQGVTGGGNPLSIFQGFMVDIKKGLFGAANLQAADFQTAASKTYGPFSPSLASNWYSINLTTGKAYINKLSTSAGLTQIRLRFKLDDNGNAIANYLSLYSGNAPAGSRPQLVITYMVP